MGLNTHRDKKKRVLHTVVLQTDDIVNTGGDTVETFCVEKNFKEKSVVVFELQVQTYINAYLHKTVWPAVCFVQMSVAEYMVVIGGQ